MKKIGTDLAVNQSTLMTSSNQVMGVKTRLKDYQRIGAALAEAVEIDASEWSFESPAEMEQYIEELRFFPARQHSR